MNYSIKTVLIYLLTMAAGIKMTLAWLLRTACISLYLCAFTFVFTLSVSFFSPYVLHHRLGFDGLAATLIPISSVSAASNISAAGQPVNAATAATAPGKVLTGDLDSSLASLAQNLSINKSAQQQVKLVFALSCISTFAKKKCFIYDKFIFIGACSGILRRILRNPVERPDGRLSLWPLQRVLVIVQW